jgi:hypothetical protein
MIARKNKAQASTSGMVLRSAALAAIVVLLAPPPATAQGRGNGGGRGRGGPTSAAVSSVAPLPAGSRQFASWLDDASVLGPGQAWTALSFGYSRFTGGHETDFPIVDASLAVAPRAQLGLSVPFYRVYPLGSPSVSGIGDVYLSAKLALVDSAAHRNGFGLAVSPLVEIQGSPSPGSPRASWAAPVSLELRVGGYRLFGTGGYFSRGAVIGGGAIEVPLTDRLMVTGALTHTRSLKADPAADLLQLPAVRTDVSGVAAYFLTSSVAVYGGTGRTLGTGSTATSLTVSGGISVTFVPRMAP